jgi:outer membrane protein OmpA-like peptidoglycan-associated protein
MKSFVLSLIVAVFAASTVAAQTTPAPPIIQSVESRWDGMYVDLLEVSRSSTGELTVRFRYRNAGKTTVAFPHLRNLIPLTMAVDAPGEMVYGALKDTDAAAVSSSTLGTSSPSGRSVAAGASQAHWVKLQAPPATVKRVTIIVPGAVPFEDVEIGARGSATPMTAPRPVLAAVDAETEGIKVEVVEVRRVAGTVNVIYRYRNGTSKPFTLPSGAEGCHRVYLLDPATRTKHEVVKTKLTERDTQTLCGTTTAYSATWGGATIPSGQALTLWAKLTAPAESTKSVSFIVPGAPPVDNLAVSGKGTASEGKSVTGAVAGLEGALKDLGAQVTEKEVRIALAADVLFDFDRADLKPEAEASLSKLTTVVTAYPTAQIRIEGHTDGKGADAYNQKLSEQRAAAVADWLASKGGVPRAQVTTAGLGKTKPIAHNTRPDGSDDPDGRARNRRVEIVVRK